MNFRPRNPLPLIVALATMLLAPALAPAHSFDWPTAAPGATAPLRENSQRGAQLPIPASRQADATLSAELHQGCGSAYGAIASESLLAPKTVADGKITGYTRHGLNQAIGREGAGVKPGAILDAVKNPKQVIQQTGGRIKYVGQNATVVTNAEGKVITTWPHGSEGLRVPAGGN
jgi:hypothetical protein